MLNRLNLGKILMIIISIVIAWGLKYHYSHSQADGLDWMLAPTSHLVQMTSGMSFEKVESTGYVDHESGIIIAPSCSGINFMIIVFCLSIYMGIKRAENQLSPFMWILFSISVSYSCTVIVNTFRILLSIYSFKTGILQDFHRQSGSRTANQQKQHLQILFFQGGAYCYPDRKGQRYYR